MCLSITRYFYLHAFVTIIGEMIQIRLRGIFTDLVFITIKIVENVRYRFIVYELKRHEIHFFLLFESLYNFFF